MHTNIDTLSLRSADCMIKAESSCCETKVVPDWLKKVDTICRIALGVFAATLSPSAFAISLGLGITTGGGYALLKFWQKQPLLARGETKPVCAQGYMDFLSGMRFPPLIGSLATATFIGAHMRHDPQFYVPFCGLFLGFWLGRETVCVAKDLGGRLFCYVKVPQKGLLSLLDS